MNIEYRLINGSRSYMVGSDGSFWSRKRYGIADDAVTMRRLKPWRCPERGYEFVQVYLDNGKKKRFALHALILTLFVGERESGQVARHLNGCPFDNRLENLAWGSQSQNMQDCLRHERTCRGERHHSTKLSESQVVEVKRRLKSESAYSLAKEFGVSKQSILAISNKKNWSWMDRYDTAQVAK